MKTIYLNTTKQSTKNIGSEEIPVFVDLEISDNPHSLGIEWDENGETYRAYYTMLRISPFGEEYLIDVIKEIQTKGGGWKFESTSIIAASSNQYIQGNIGATFGDRVSQETEGAINEIEFFVKYCGHGAAGLGNLAVPIFKHILYAIERHFGFRL